MEGSWVCQAGPWAPSLGPLAQGCSGLCGTCTARLVRFSCSWYWVSGLGQVATGCPHECSNILPGSSATLWSLQNRAVQINFWSICSLEPSRILRELCTSHILLGSAPHLSCHILAAPRNGDRYDPAMSPLTRGVQFPVTIVQSVQLCLEFDLTDLFPSSSPIFFHCLSKVLFPLKTWKKKYPQGSRFSVRVLYSESLHTCNT